MDFGIQFFPDVGPAEKTGKEYWQEALELVTICDELGYTHVRTVEHYFNPYGGYSPNPIVFLTAAAMRSKKTRLITGAVLPVFNHPLKLAGEIGMLDAISCGRLEVGFARAFLPHEFARFGVSVHESRERFEEGMEQVRRLLEEENVTIEGKFHSFKNVTSLPRPTQKPRPPFWGGRLFHARELYQRRCGRPLDNGHPNVRHKHEGTSSLVPRRLARGGLPWPRPRDARVSHVLRRDHGRGGSRCSAAT